MDKPQRGSRIQKRPKNVNGKGRFDSALIRAKNEQRDVYLFLSVDLPWAVAENKSEAEGVIVQILEVDTYAVKIKNKDGRESWIGKSFIVEAAILGT